MVEAVYNDNGQLGVRKILEFVFLKSLIAQEAEVLTMAEIWHPLKGTRF